MDCSCFQFFEAEYRSCEVLSISSKVFANCSTSSVSDYDIWVTLVNQGVIKVIDVCRWYLIHQELKDAFIVHLYR